MNIEIFKNLVYVTALGLVCLATTVFAQNVDSHRTQTALDYSLTSLYQKAEEISEHNEWLQTEIKALQDERRLLEQQSKLIDREIMVMKDNTHGVSNDFEARVRELQLSKTNLMLLNDQLKELENEKNRLEKEFYLKQDRKARLQSEIAAAINRLGSVGLENVDPKIARLDSDFRIERARIAKLKSEMFEEMKHLEGKIAQIKGQDGATFEKYSAIQKENNTLKLQVKSIQAEIDALKERSDKLSAVIYESKTDDGLEQRIAKLKERRLELRDYLAKVDEKLKNANLYGNIDDQEKNLENNLLVIKKENTQLNEELDKILRQNQASGIFP